MNKYTSIKQLISNLKTRISEDRMLISALKATPVTTEQIMLLKYIEIGSTSKTAKVMRESGIRSPTGKSFLAPDVSDLIRSGHESLDPILFDFARGIFRGNKKAVNREFN